jgi:tetratricopeptide (TPR) repeat protein
MLLSSSNTHQQHASEEAFIIQLIGQQRYAEAYILLKKEPPSEPSVQYNLALCHYWAQNYQEALLSLDKIMINLPAGYKDAPHDPFYAIIRERQNQEDEHLQAISKKHVTFFGLLVKDAIVRLKVDCWLQLGNFPKVIEIAMPIATRNYKNIVSAIQTAKNKSNYEQ